jgi:hypothetical protein
VTLFPVQGLEPIEVTVSSSTTELAPNVVSRTLWPRSGAEREVGPTIIHPAVMASSLTLRVERAMATTELWD